ncbi:MAG TPA: OmpA family protein [Anaeromyxobacteraceae bacterium]|jgi:outer membrane protein OmpA-like peptidoglycan-associated protein
MRKPLALALAAACSALPAVAAPPKGKAAPKAPPPLNLTGKWEAMQAGFYGKMRQAGSVISGRCKHECAYQGQCDQPGVSQCHIRGAFLGDHVVFTTFTTLSATSEPCARSTFLAPNTGKLSPLSGRWYGEESRPDGITRTSADGGGPVSFPYADELERCGDIVTYELSFDVGSAAIKNPDAPVLAAMAELLRAKPAAKLRIVGHTDSTGSAETNKKLSLDRAGSVKARILELARGDPGRIAAEGMGPDQPLESNDTPAGRALNRRVEITAGR